MKTAIHALRDAQNSRFVDRLWHLTLPALALALSVMAIVVKITRAAMIEELDKDYVTFARARGLSATRISPQSTSSSATWCRCG